MDHSEIQKRVDAPPALMNAKGLREPSAEFTLQANDKSTLALSWQKPNSDRYFDREYEWVRDPSNDPEVIVEEAIAFIASLPTRDERLRRAFLEHLAKTIELGKSAHIEVEFVNPLVVLMKTLSENAIEDKSSAA